jgi:TonB family protein
MRRSAELLLLLTCSAHAQTVQLDLATAPRAKGPIPVTYPVREADRNQEGWVQLDFMIDPNGRTYEVTVADSTGSKSFEAAAVQAAEKWQFEPAMLQDKPIDTSFRFKLYFDHPYAKGVRRDFSKEYDKAVAAIEGGDRKRAEATLARLTVQSLEEDAFASLARYRFEARWGTEAGQIAALRRAIADETAPGFLPAKQFIAALQALLPLELRAKDFARALWTWDVLKKLQPDDAIIAQLQPTIDDATALRTDDRTYSVPGAIEPQSSSWFYALHKRRFQIVVASGRVSEIKLRCDREYVSFAYDPALYYRIDQHGNCRLQLIGEPGTRFELIQS